MMGTSVCKPCVRYASNCLQSSSSESGTYTLKMRDDTKLRLNKPRSSSISADSSGINASGFWNSWESIQKINAKELKRQCQSFSKSAHVIGGDKTSDSAKHILQRNLSYEATRPCSSKNRKAWNPEHPTENCGENRKYLESLQVEGTSSSSCSCEELPSSLYELENDQIQIHQANLEAALPSTSNIRQNTSTRNGDSGSFIGVVKDSGEGIEKTAPWINNPESSLSTNIGNIEPNVTESCSIGPSGSSGIYCGNSEGLMVSKAQSALTGAIPKIKKLFTPIHETQDVVLSENQHLHNQQHGNLSEEEGKALGDLKNMTAEVGVQSYINHSIGRDTGDNGNSFLNRISPALLLSTDKGRLKTYKNWPNKNMDPKKLAAAGFYYSGKTDVVQCFRCGIKGHNWLETDEPMEDHIKWNKNCPFVRENATEQDNAPQSRPGRDYCGNMGVEMSPYSESEKTHDYYLNLMECARTKLPAQEPSCPDYILPANRLSTFENWPEALKQKPAQLAEAGFYYCGIGDQTKCFFCGGGLKNWAEEDDPWEQHALWFPQCNYLLLKKTSAFVETVQQKHKTNLWSKQDEAEKLATSSTSKNAKESPSAAVEKRETNNADEGSTLCKICYANNCDVVFLPCSHLITCADCATGPKQCPSCRKEIKYLLRVYT